MNIQEMHTSFRVVGQQAGQQLIRGVLPETIDFYINNAIVEIVRVNLLTGVRTAFQDSVNTQATTISPINIFRGLYRTTRISPVMNADALTQETNGYGDVGENCFVTYYNSNNGYHIFTIPTTYDENIESDSYSGRKINPMMYLGFALEYLDTERGDAVACRLIGADVLETTLRDYCNSAEKSSPIIVINNFPNSADTTSQSFISDQIELYTGTKDLLINTLVIKYIKQPNIVKYDIDLTKCINCDLPDYTHYEIVEKAVDKFTKSVAGIPQQSSNRTSQQ